MAERDIWLQLVIFYGSYLVFPFLIGCLWLWWRGKRKWLAGLGVLLGLMFIWMRFVEPQWIVVRQERFRFAEVEDGESVRVAVMADHHLGVYKGRGYLERVVEKVNELEPDIVLMPGDFTYEPEIGKLQDLFAPLREVEAPMYGVAGNHDSGNPGYVKAEDVIEALESSGVSMLDNRSVKVLLKGKKLRLVGLSDYWADDYNLSILEDLQEGERSIVLAHNPDSAFDMADVRADLVLAGHTHGGQIRVPWLYKLMIPTANDFDRGWYEIGANDVFVTSGLGETALPMRFLVPPEIVLMEMEI